MLKLQPHRKTWFRKHNLQSADAVSMLIFHVSRSRKRSAPKPLRPNEHFYTKTPAGSNTQRATVSRFPCSCRLWSLFVLPCPVFESMGSAAHQLRLFHAKYSPQLVLKRGLRTDYLQTGICVQFKMLCITFRGVGRSSAQAAKRSLTSRRGTPASHQQLQ